MTKLRKYTKEYLEPLVKQSTSYANLLRNIGVSSVGSSHAMIQERVKRHNLDTSHFTNKQGHNKGFLKYPIEEYLSNKCKIGSDALKKRLIKESIFEHKCYDCGLTEWKNNPVPIELHHIDENHNNNNLDNLIILCPNCHRCKHGPNLNSNQYYKRGKCVNCKQPCSTKAAKCRTCFNIEKNSKSYICPYCQKKCVTNVKKCRKCSNKRPSVEQLKQDMIDLNNNKCAIGRKYGVSDNAVKRWIVKYDL